MDAGDVIFFARGSAIVGCPSEMREKTGCHGCFCGWVYVHGILEDEVGLVVGMGRDLRGGELC
jgi:hypothetical protein